MRTCHLAVSTYRYVYFVFSTVQDYVGMLAEEYSLFDRADMKAVPKTIRHKLEARNIQYPSSLHKLYLDRHRFCRERHTRELRPPFPHSSWLNDTFCRWGIAVGNRQLFHPNRIRSRLREFLCHCQTRNRQWHSHSALDKLDLDSKAAHPPLTNSLTPHTDLFHKRIFRYISGRWWWQAD